MTKKSFGSVLCVFLPVILLCLLFAGCACKHEWQAANCETPKTCTLCQITEGEALGHSWADATCSAPKTCSVCSTTEGDALPHTWADATCSAPKTCSVCSATEGDALPHTWVDATCAVPKTCSVCNTTEGDALGHKWVDTCTIPKFCSVCFEDTGDPPGHTWKEATTEAPQTCTKCGKTEGSKISADPRFTTSACKPLFGTWKGIVKLPGKDFIDKDFIGTLELDYAITFYNTGRYQETVKIINEEQFTKNVESYYIDTLYKDFSAQGYSKAQADEAMTETYGMDVRAYAKKMANSFNYDTLFSTDVTGMYFVSDGKLYSGSKWAGQMESAIFSISGNTLSIDSLSNETPVLVLTKS